MPIPPVTYDDMNGVPEDLFFTYDDPLFNSRTNAAYDLQTVTRDGARLYMAWAKGDTPEIDTAFARDLFVRTAVAGDWGTTTFGQVWSDNSAQFSTDGTQGVIAANATNTLYEAVITGVTSRDFDTAIKVKVPVLFTGAKGAFYIIARYVDANNYLRIRMDFNTDQIIGYGVEQKVGGVFTSIASGLILGSLHTTTDWFWLRAQGVADRISLKVWTDGTPEPDVWPATTSDLVYQSTSGLNGMGFTLFSGNSNSLPYNAYVYTFFAGVADEYDVGAIRTSASLDDGLPTEVTNTGNIGINELVAELRGPIGTPSSTHFSTFRTDQPYNDIARDIASVSLNSGVVTSDGVRTGRVFTGLMADIPTPPDGATLKAVSRTRLRLSTLIHPPAVHGFYEGGEATWAIGYALWKSGVNIAPPLIPGCRLYFPFNGALHSYLPDDNLLPYQMGVIEMTSAPAIGSYVRPKWIDGPFTGTAAPDVEINATRTARVTDTPTNIRFGPGDDFLSLAGNKGRISFWVKGDPTDVAGSLDTGLDDIVKFSMSNGGSRFVRIGIGAGDRQPFLWLSDGVGSQFVRTATTLPADGQWHFIGGSWDIAANTVTVVIDSQVTVVSAGSMSTANLPEADDVQFPNIRFYVPVAQMRFTTGKFAPAAQAVWEKDIPWAAGAITRRSMLELDAVAEPAPVQAYEFITRFSRGELAVTGFDNLDRFLYLPAPYWVELEQLQAVETLSTATNLGKDFDPVRDLSKIYNQISLTYTDTKVQELWTAALQSSELVLIPNGTSVVQYTFDNPIVEVRGLTFSVLSGTQLEATPPSASNAINYITANTVIDGSGAYATSFDLVVTIDSWTPGGAVVRFVNDRGPLYIVNNVNLPAIGIAAKRVDLKSTAVSAQNTQSIALREARMLATTVPGIQNRDDAQSIANELVARLSQPRVAFTSSAFGDTRRAPGKLVNVTDPDGTNITGQFRLTGISTSQDGPKIDQSLSGLNALPVLVWGQGTWGESLWGGG